LRAGALFAEASGSLDRASDLLRSLVGGLPPRTEPWFNAKVDQLRVLAKLSPERARAVLAQFRALYPDLGPEPHRSNILEIEKSLPAEESAEVPAKVPAEKPSETPAKQAPVDASGAKAAP
jgi:truncated hemoglobin YjbI